MPKGVTGWKTRIVCNHNPTATTPAAPWVARVCTLALALALAACTTLEPAAPPPATPAPVLVKTPPRIGLALGGGAARGFAHVGVIQVLEEAGIRPSLVAALYASGRSGAELQQLAESLEEAALTDWSLPLLGRGALKGEALARYVSGLVHHKLIEDMPLPLGIVATDLGNGQGVLFRRGSTGTAVRASSAVPSVFQPVHIGGRDYVDGGLVAPVPVEYARQMGAQVVVAVDISSPPDGQATGDSLSILLQTFAIMSKSINRFELKAADVVVRPALDGVKSADFSAKRRAIEAGRQAMRQALPQLRQALAAPS